MKKFNKLMLFMMMVGANVHPHPPAAPPATHTPPKQDPVPAGPAGLYSTCIGVSDSEHGTCPGKLYCVKKLQNNNPSYQKTKQGETGSCREGRGV